MLKLQILKKDIEEENYFNSNDCPITRALRRAGKAGWRHVGMGIDDEHGDCILDSKDEDLEELDRKVRQMCKSLNPKYFQIETPTRTPEDFTFLLPIN